MSDDWSSNRVPTCIDPVPFQQSVDIAETHLVRVQAQSRQDLAALKTAQTNLRQSTAQEILAQSRYEGDKKIVDSGTYSENRLERRVSDLDQDLQQWIRL